MFEESDLRKLLRIESASRSARRMQKRRGERAVQREAAQENAAETHVRRARIAKCKCRWIYRSTGTEYILISTVCSHRLDRTLQTASESEPFGSEEMA